MTCLTDVPGNTIQSLVIQTKTPGDSQKKPGLRIERDGLSENLCGRMVFCVTRDPLPSSFDASGNERLRCPTKFRPIKTIAPERPK